MSFKTLLTLNSVIKTLLTLYSVTMSEVAFLDEWEVDEEEMLMDARKKAQRQPKKVRARRAAPCTWSVHIVSLTDANISVPSVLLAHARAEHCSARPHYAILQVLEHVPIKTARMRPGEHGRGCGRVHRH